MKMISTPKDQEAKTYRLEDRVLIRDLPAEASQVHIWIPLLLTDEHQRVMGVEVDSPFPLPLRHEREFGNPMLHGVAFALFPREISLGVRYQVIRQPLHLDLDPAKAGWVTGRREPFHRFLLPERYVRVDASCACKYGYAGFGTLDLNHVAFSRGRDLLLEPPQRGDRLLYFASAYVEVDGARHEGVERRLAFTTL